MLYLLLIVVFARRIVYFLKKCWEIGEVLVEYFKSILDLIFVRCMFFFFSLDDRRRVGENNLVNDFFFDVLFGS